MDLVCNRSIGVADRSRIYHILRIFGISSPFVGSQQMLIDIQIQFLCLLSAYLEVIDSYAVEVILVVQIIYAVTKTLILLIDVIDFRSRRIHVFERVKKIGNK